VFDCFFSFCNWLFLSFWLSPNSLAIDGSFGSSHSWAIGIDTD
jgi:hypothetical protein